MSVWLNWIELHPLATAIVAGVIVILITLPFTKSWAFSKATKVGNISLADSPYAQVSVGDNNEFTQIFQQGSTILVNGKATEPLPPKRFRILQRVALTMKAKISISHFATCRLNGMCNSQV
jgi:hypothetical protein